MNIFEECQTVNDLLSCKNEFDARDKLIEVLDYHSKNKIPYSELVNHLIRQVGLYPYIQTDTASWQESYLYEMFKVDIAGKETVLHREQSYLLKKILSGQSIAVSAPTSFGKSFIVDAFITLKKPKNVVLVVPTIALTDEIRRRIYKKFSLDYRIITTPEVDLQERNIFIFPQERALNYINKIKEIDLLIIDEFYKASFEFDKERSGSLLKAMVRLGKISKQKYFLAPNIQEIKDNSFTKDLEFMELKFQTVCLKLNEIYRDIKGDKTKKDNALLRILNNVESKSLIY